MKATRTITEPHVAKALSHPLRTRILTILEERSASPRELADELGVPLPNVSYHVRALASLKLIKLVERVAKRGAIEHYYEAIATGEITDEVWAEAPALAKRAVLARAVGDVAEDVNSAVSYGGFNRADAHLTRTGLVLDEEGWSELADELVRVLERVDRLRAESAQRMAADDSAGTVRGALVMMLFERGSLVDAPPPARARPRGDRTATE